VLCAVLCLTFLALPTTKPGEEEIPALDRLDPLCICPIPSQDDSASLASLAIMTTRYKQVRQQLGALSCATKGIGPTGGFCLQKDTNDVGGNSQWCSPVAELLRAHFAGQSVYDFGAGLGWYGKVFVRPATSADPGPSEYHGFDGAENVEEVTDNFVSWLDLAEEVHLNGPADWVLSFEVGEHVPPEFEDIFIQNLHRHNRKGVIVSWALEGQSGHFHVNNHNNNYVKAKFDSLGYDNDLAFETKLRQAATLSWFRATIMVFTRR